MTPDNRTAPGERTSDDLGANRGSASRGEGSPAPRGRGFAGMDPKKQRAIASEGGKAAHASGNAHEFDSEEARRAGALSHGRRARAAASSGGSPSATASITPSTPSGGSSRIEGSSDNDRSER